MKYTDQELKELQRTTEPIFVVNALHPAAIETLEYYIALADDADVLDMDSLADLLDQFKKTQSVVPQAEWANISEDILTNQPKFVIRGKDILAYKTITKFAELSNDEDVAILAQETLKWQNKNYQLVKIPS